MEQISGGHVLRGQDAVHGLQRKLSPAVKKIGKMRLAEPRLPGKQRYAERPPLYPAQQFQAETLVHLSKVHLWKIRRWQRRRRLSHFLPQNDGRKFSFILQCLSCGWKGTTVNRAESIDVEDTGF